MKTYNQNNFFKHTFCEFQQANDFMKIPVPWRRDSTFELLYHKENGFYENKWTWTDTRKNQLHFYNKVLKGKL